MKMLLLVCLLFVAGCQFSAKIDGDSFSIYYNGVSSFIYDLTKKVK